MNKSKSNTLSRKDSEADAIAAGQEGLLPGTKRNQPDVASKEKDTPQKKKRVEEHTMEGDSVHLRELQKKKEQLVRYLESIDAKLSGEQKRKKGVANDEIQQPRRSKEDRTVRRQEQRSEEQRSEEHESEESESEESESEEHEQSDSYEVIDIVEEKKRQKKERLQQRRSQLKRLKKEIASWPKVVFNFEQYNKGELILKPKVRYILKRHDERFFTVKYIVYSIKGEKEEVMFKYYNGNSKAIYYPMHLRTDRDRMEYDGRLFARNTFARDENILFPGLPAEGKKFYIEHMNVKHVHNKVYGDYKPFTTPTEFTMECVNLKTALLAGAEKVLSHLDLDKIRCVYGQLPSLAQLAEFRDVQLIWLSISEDDMFINEGSSYYREYVNKVYTLLFPDTEEYYRNPWVRENGMFMRRPSLLYNKEAAQEIGFPWFQWEEGNDPTNESCKYSVCALYRIIYIKPRFNVDVFCSAMVLARYYATQTDVTSCKTKRESGISFPILF